MEDKNDKKKIWYSPKYGHVFPGKYLIFGVIGIVGIFYFDNILVRIILGIYIFGCLLGLIFGDR
jgi:hypothetical protein